MEQRINPENYAWVPRETVTEPRGNVVEVLRDHWWMVNTDGEVCLYRDRGREYPLCNTNRSLVERLARSTPGVVDFEKLPLAFMPINLSDYRH